MKQNIFTLIGQYFRLWFLPQPAHDDLFMEQQQTKEQPAQPPGDSPFQVTAPALESAADMEQRAARELTREHLNLHDQDLSALVKPPEGAGDRASRDSNPFSRTPFE